MNVLIIEDEDLTAERLEDLLKKYDPAIRVAAMLPSVRETVQWLQTHSPGHPDYPDLIFMDIHLEDDLCFRIFEQVNLSVPIIFTTAFDEYMIKAFRVNSIDYLLKPVSFEALAAAMQKYHSLKRQFSLTDLEALRQVMGQPRQEYKNRFLITVGTRLRTIETGEVAYFFSEEKITFLVTRDNQRLPLDFSLDKLATMLNPADFFRANRQFLVALPSIKNIHTYSSSKLKLELQPDPRTEVFISKEKVSTFKDWLDA
ncbi:LytR/AlgR family response regulator transcription factor [Tellurirhabdus rosea]|uniref:LytR/AlgR family response regulator transcription factor n=1 Tax=Tellurirhabdus rosea TaxID=2674997 RepID=UPI002253492B|nr:LytTR family DNA-binding domain-containing protein [Tellurirhabdus rosea]